MKKIFIAAAFALIECALLMLYYDHKMERVYEHGILDGAAYTYTHGFYPSMWHRGLMESYRKNHVEWNHFSNSETKEFWDSVDLHYKPMWDSVTKEMNDDWDKFIKNQK